MMFPEFEYPQSNVPKVRSRRRWFFLALGPLLAFSLLIVEPWLDSRFGDSRAFEKVDGWQGQLNAAWRVALESVGEETILTPDPVEGSIPLCEPLSPLAERAMTEAIALMRATNEGARLYDLIDQEGVCIRTELLDFNSAYALSRWSSERGWSESQIVIGKDYVDLLYPDVLAAILTHEAKHIERAVTRTACYYADACTELSNGVELEEEIAAHEAEAKWWIEAYGRNGKDWAFGPDSAENRLKAAYLQGPGGFREFVRQARSGSREGENL